MQNAQRLRPYQERCLAAAEIAAKNGVTRQLWVLATGLGKSTLAAEFIRRRVPRGTFGLMHRQELLDQASERLLQFNPGAKVGIEKAESSASADDDIILASVQTVGRDDARSKARIPAKDWVRTFWIDEFHHSVSNSYLNVCDALGFRAEVGEEPRRDAILIGTTATPERLDALGYDSVVDDVVYRYDLPEAIRDGWLARIHAFRVETDLDLSDVRSRAGDFVERDLAKAIFQSNLTDRAVQTWEEHGRGKDSRSIFFCVDKEHAAKTLESLKHVGAKAEIVTDETPRDARRGIVAAYKEGNLDCLVNVGVFTEGFDAPQTNAIYLLRPTQSRSLYMQAVGRGTRKADGKEKMDLFDCTPRGIPAASINEIFGLPDAWQLEDSDVLEDKEKLEEIQEKLPMDLSSISSLEELQTIQRRVELFRSSLVDSGLVGSKLAWMRCSGRETWKLAWRNPSPWQVGKLPGHVRARFEEAAISAKLLGQREGIDLYQNELGKWEVAYWGPLGGRVLGAHPRRREAIAQAEEEVRQKRPHVVGLLIAKGAWRTAPASEKQIEVVVKRGVPADSCVGLTKQEASALIDMGEKELKDLFCGSLVSS